MRKRDNQNRLYLTAKGLSKTAAPSFEKDFTFIVGNHIYRCTKYGATFISPKVASLFFLDPTFDSFEIDLDDSEYQFKMVERLMYGHSIELNGESSKYLCEVSKLLENREIQGIIERMTDEMDVKTIVPRIQYRIANQLKNDKEIAFAAAHFDKIPDESLLNLDVSAFESILTHPNLSIPTEDYLFRRILSLGENFSVLLSYVQCQYLSDASIKDFLNVIAYTDMNSFLWQSLIDRLLLSVKPEKNPKRHKKNNPSFNFEANREFNGMIDYLVKEYKGGSKRALGPDFNEFITITSVGDTYNKSYQVCDYDWKDYWISKTEPNAWIKFDLLNRSATITGYTIKSDGNGAGHLLGWKIEGSNDNVNWTVLDQRETNELNQNYITRYFKCSQHKESYRYIKLTQTSKNSSGMDSMMLCNIEFFGELEEDDLNLE